jgi:hypothetical protein
MKRLKKTISGFVKTRKFRLLAKASAECRRENIITRSIVSDPDGMF